MIKVIFVGHILGVADGGDLQVIVPHQWRRRRHISTAAVTAAFPHTVYIV
jgi:hypothetical protein